MCYQWWIRQTSRAKIARASRARPWIAARMILRRISQSSPGGGWCLSRLSLMHLRCTVGFMGKLPVTGGRQALRARRKVRSLHPSHADDYADDYKYWMKHSGVIHLLADDLEQ